MAVTWQEFADAAPELAHIGQKRLHGRVSYLATSRRTDGAPRVHPVTPGVSERRLFLFMEPTSPKGRDLRLDPRFALHCGVENDHGGDGEFFLSGIAEVVDDPEVRAEAEAAAPFKPSDRYVLFELKVDRADFRTYNGSGEPEQQTWKAA